MKNIENSNGGATKESLASAAEGVYNALGTQVESLNRTIPQEVRLIIDPEGKVKINLSKEEFIKKYTENRSHFLGDSDKNRKGE